MPTDHSCKVTVTTKVTTKTETSSRRHRQLRKIRTCCISGGRLTAVFLLVTILPLLLLLLCFCWVCTAFSFLQEVPAAYLVSRHHRHRLGTSTTTTTTRRRRMATAISADAAGERDESNSKIIDGKGVAKQIRAEIKERVGKLCGMHAPTSKPPGLAVVLVGSRRDSQTYVNMKKKACEQAGIHSIGYDFDDTVSQNELLETINKLNDDDNVHGILIQLPLPPQINQDTVLRAVDPTKDVDGLHPVNVANLQLFAGDAMQAPFSIPCTPLGCLTLLDRYDVPLRGKHCVVIGRSQLVGLPMARLLIGKDATVTIVHSKTQNIQSVVKQGDVVIAAVGKPRLVKSDWLKNGAVVIDVGINSVDVIVKRPADVPEGNGGSNTGSSAAGTGGDNTSANKKSKSYKLVGDVDYDDCIGVCRKITPVPGGVGPMTIAMLLKNTVASYERRINKLATTTETTTTTTTTPDTNNAGTGGDTNGTGEKK